MILEALLRHHNQIYKHATKFETLLYHVNFRSQLTALKSDQYIKSYELYREGLCKAALWGVVQPTQGITREGHHHHHLHHHVHPQLPTTSTPLSRHKHNPPPTGLRVVFESEVDLLTGLSPPVSLPSPPVHLSTFQPVDLSTLQPVDLPTFEPVDLSTFQTVHLSTFQPVDLPTFVPVDLSTCQPAYLKVYLSFLTSSTNLNPIALRSTLYRKSTKVVLPV